MATWFSYGNYIANFKRGMYMFPIYVLEQSKNYSETPTAVCVHFRGHINYFKGIIHLQGHFNGLNVRNEILHFNLARTLKNEYKDNY